MSRPTKFTQELADQICDLIATSSKGLRAICAELKISPSSVYLWLANEDNKAFSDRYARAKEQQADFLAEEIIEISDALFETTERTECLSGEGSYTSATTKDNYNRSRLMIDARKWLAAKLAPKKYGDKLDIEYSGNVIRVLVEGEDGEETN